MRTFFISRPRVWFGKLAPHLMAEIIVVNAMLKQLRLLGRSEPAIWATRPPELEADLQKMGFGQWVVRDIFTCLPCKSVWTLRKKVYFSGPSTPPTPTLFFWRPLLTPMHLAKATLMAFPAVHRSRSELWLLKKGGPSAEFVSNHPMSLTSYDTP